MARAVRNDSKDRYRRQVEARWQTGQLTVRAYCEAHAITRRQVAHRRIAKYGVPAAPARVVTRAGSAFAGRGPESLRGGERRKP